MRAQRRKINAENNPCGLTMAERKFAIDLVNSIQDSLAERRRISWNSSEVEHTTRVLDSAIAQFAGVVKKEGPFFKLKLRSDTVLDSDMQYVMDSLGVSR